MVRGFYTFDPKANSFQYLQMIVLSLQMGTMGTHPIVLEFCEQ